MIAWHWECLEETDSTNRVAEARVLECWARGASAEGLVIMAARQSAGRGRHGRRWESPPGGLYLSAVVEELPEAIRERMALLAGVAVVDALASPETYSDEEQARREAWAIRAIIRWPNDVMLGEKKVAGVLCQAVARGERWAGIVGIGINVLTDMTALPSSLRSSATSLLAHDGRLRTLTGTGHAVVQTLSHWRNRVREKGLAAVIERVRELDMLRGRHVTYEDQGRVIEAVAEGIDETGRLLLRRGEWEVNAVEHGSILSVGAPV